MLVNDRHLLGLSVETDSGTHLGRVVGLTVQTETHRVEQYEVRRGGVKGLGLPHLLISWTQVKAITEEKMVVEDAAIKEPLVAMQGAQAT